VFSAEELAGCLEEEWFRLGYSFLERTLLRARLAAKPDEQVSFNRTAMARFAQAVIASASGWKDPRAEPGRQLCQAAGDVEAGLAVLAESGTARRDHVLRAALLYDLAGMPGTAATLAARDGIDQRIVSYFSRAHGSLWGHLAEDERALQELVDRASLDSAAPDLEELFYQALGDIVLVFGDAMQQGEAIGPSFKVLRVLAERSGWFSTPLSSDDLLAMLKSFELRHQHATINILQARSKTTESTMRLVHAPLELWPVQKSALEHGLLDPDIINFGLAAPTGTGKTSLMRTFLADFFSEVSEQKVHLHFTKPRACVTNSTRYRGAFRSSQYSCAVSGWAPHCS
jgi:hypothetical protein